MHGYYLPQSLFDFGSLLDLCRDQSAHSQPQLSLPLKRDLVQVHSGWDARTLHMTNSPLCRLRAQPVVNFSSEGEYGSFISPADSTDGQTLL